MNDKIIKATLMGIGTVVTGVVAGITVNAIGKVSIKAIETNFFKEILFVSSPKSQILPRLIGLFLYDYMGFGTTDDGSCYY